MKIKSVLQIPVLVLLSLAFVPGPRTANAAMISTGQAVSRLSHDAERKKIAEFVNRSDVKTQLIKYGVNPAEASMRLASLSDKEVKNLSAQIDSSTAGGDPIVGVLSLVLIILLIIFLAQRI